MVKNKQDNHKVIYKDYLKNKIFTQTFKITFLNSTSLPLLIMIEKDYIKKKIDLFVKELVSLLSKEPPKEEKLKELALLAQKYTEKNLSYFLHSDTDTILLAYKTDTETLDIIAEILFQLPDLNKDILYKIRDIIHYINRNSTDFSFQRNQNLTKIEALLRAD